MAAPLVEFDREPPEHRGDLAAEMDDQFVHVPALLKSIAESLRASTASQLAAAMEMVPGAFCEVLGWTEDELARARSDFMDQLRLRYPGLKGLRDTNRSTSRRFGAIRPEALRDAGRDR